MTSYTNIPNASVVVGAIPSSTLVTALRDNPIAIAESETAAPFSVYGWHPHDGGVVGTNTGVIYDFAITGAVSEVVTPDFVDGYEYRFIAMDLSSTGTGSLEFEIWKQTAAVWQSASFMTTASAADFASLDATFDIPRLPARWHFGQLNMTNSAGARADTRWTAFNATPQPILRARLRYAGNNFDSGKMWLFRRREFTT